MEMANRFGHYGIWFRPQAAGKRSDDNVNIRAISSKVDPRFALRQKDNPYLALCFPSSKRPEKRRLIFNVR